MRNDVYEVSYVGWFIFSIAVRGVFHWVRFLWLVLVDVLLRSNEFHMFYTLVLWVVYSRLKMFVRYNKVDEVSGNTGTLYRSSISFRGTLTPTVISIYPYCITTC
jgi:hypothetical protein